MDQLPPICIPTGDQARQLCMCPDQEGNWQLSGAQDHARPTEPHQPGMPVHSLKVYSDIST